MVMKRKSFVAMLIAVLPFGLFAQNVGIGTLAPHNSAMLDVQSSNKGVSLPSMTTAQRNAIPSPKTGLLVFDLDKNTIFMFDGDSGWRFFSLQRQPQFHQSPVPLQMAR
jgi:hypothetical protein